MTFWTGGADPARPFTVTVGVSATSGSPTALSWAVGEARVHGGLVVAVRAWRPPRPPAAVGGKPSVVRHDVDELRAQAEEDLRRQVRQALGDQAQVECRLLEGGRRAILVLASAAADLLVIDTPRLRDRAGSPRFVRGLIARSHCPVVVMPPALIRPTEPDHPLADALARAAASAGRPGIRPPAAG